MTGDWGDVGRLLANLGIVAAFLWAVARMVFLPMARNAANEAAERLYERLKSNDFRHVEEGMKALADRLTETRIDLGGRMERMDARLAEARAEWRGIGAAIEEVRHTVAVLADRKRREPESPSPER